MKKYELYNLTTGELLADNLTFEEVPELFEAYAGFFPDCEIVACYRESKLTMTYAKVVNPDEIYRRNFNAEWLEFMDELISMGNIN